MFRIAINTLFVRVRRPGFDSPPKHVSLETPTQDGDDLGQDSPSSESKNTYSSHLRSAISPLHKPALSSTELYLLYSPMNLFGNRGRSAVAGNAAESTWATNLQNGKVFGLSTIFNQWVLAALRARALRSPVF
jgi:hypothetical protein